MDDNNQPQTTETTQQIMTFDDQGTSQEVQTLVKPMPLPRELIGESLQQRREHTILDFLQRPIPIAQFDMRPTDGPNAQLLVLDFPETFVNQILYLEKVSGFVGLTGTLCLKLVANVQPFQAGALRMAYVPNAQNMPNKDATLAGNLTSFVSLPGVDMRFPLASTAQLRIPFISPQLAVNLTNGEGAYGRLRIHVYSPLRSGATNEPIGLTLFVHMEDPKVEFPTGAPVADSLLLPQQASALKMLREVRRPAIRAEYHSALDIPKAEEVDIKKTGTVTKVLLAGSGVAGVAALFPPLTAVAAPLAVGLGALGGVTSLFGWSKPGNLGGTAFNKLVGAQSMANANGEDSSHKLAFCAGNSIDIPKGILNTGSDELALPFIQSTPGYLQTVLWSTSNVADEILISLPATPVASRLISGRSVVAMPLMAYVANRFCQWRGDLVYTFKVIKTQYHSGRLRFSFVPGHYGNFDLDGIDVNKCLTAILDLKESDSVQFRVPYVSTTPWMFCNWNDNLAVPIGNNKFTQGTPTSATGTLFATVLNPLVATETVTPIIEILVEVSGDPSLRFSVPKDPTYIPTSEQLNRIEEDKPIQAEYQSNFGPLSVVPLTRTEFQEGARATVLGDSEGSDATRFTAERLTVGETVLSARLFLKRFTQMSAMRTIAISILPFGKNTPLNGATLTTQPFDDYSYWSYPFAFARGSMRLKITTDAQREDNFSQTSLTMLFTWVTDHYSRIWQALADDYTPTSQPVESTSPVQFLTNASIQQVVPLSIEGVAELEVPFYNRMHNIPLEINQPLDSNSVEKGNFPSPILVAEPIGFSTTGEAPTYGVYRAVGEDFTMSFLLGAPLMRLNSTLN